MSGLGLQMGASVEELAGGFFNRIAKPSLVKKLAGG